MTVEFFKDETVYPCGRSSWSLLLMCLTKYESRIPSFKNFLAIEIDLNTLCESPEIYQVKIGLQFFNM